MSSESKTIDTSKNGVWSYGCFGYVSSVTEYKERLWNAVQSGRITLDHLVVLHNAKFVGPRTGPGSHVEVLKAAGAWAVAQKAKAA